MNGKPPVSAAPPRPSALLPPTRRLHSKPASRESHPQIGIVDLWNCRACSIKNQVSSITLAIPAFVKDMIGISRVAPLTSIRGLAAWWVAIYHFREYLPTTSDSWIVAIAVRGFYAVDLFFILSGFVLHLNYSRLFWEPNRHSLYTFAIARFARVYPLHFFMMLVFLLNPLMITIFSHKGLGPVQSRYNLIDYIMSCYHSVVALPYLFRIFYLLYPFGTGTVRTYRASESGCLCCHHVVTIAAQAAQRGGDWHWYHRS